MTVHRQGARDLLDRMLDHPGAARILADTRRRFKLPAGHPAAFDDGYVAAIGQMFQTGPSWWPMEQIAAFAAVHTQICSGEVAQVLIGAEGLDGGPHEDARRAENTARLAHLPSPFHAAVDALQHGADCDGALKWDAPIKADAASGAVLLDACRQGVKQPVPIVATVASGWAPLEIGSTMASRTLVHLLEAGAVARWPYGSDFIHLLVRRGGPASVPLPGGRRPARLARLPSVDLSAYDLVPLLDMADLP